MEHPYVGRERNDSASIILVAASYNPSQCKHASRSNRVHYHRAITVIRKTNRGSEENERKVIVNRNYLRENNEGAKGTVLHNAVTSAFPYFGMFWDKTPLETIG